MKKITMLLAAIGLAASTTVLAENLVKVSTPYAFLKDGSRIEGTLDELCDALAKDNDDVHHRTVHAYFRSFAGFSRDGDSSRSLACWVKSQYLSTDDKGNFIWLPPFEALEYNPVSSYGPAICYEGGLYSSDPDYCYTIDTKK